MDMGWAGAEIKKIKGKWAQLGDDVPHMRCLFLHMFGVASLAEMGVLMGFGEG